ncbi:hypothetical protein [Priestia taiwanensis]|uniref:Uncharacterized protein n=1 Tax=Priestia taiwanensis TaxID=1347902 RepID=A0A917ARC5_9BACI|nr:hypothetical protein [Priestia taiwanensis]MBM7362737.1 hypothetical protein [Priestia taiwanensis]GGE64662.1 hypothetical protein GCM10007140_13610 [Priestia taiwanensis]
MIKQPEMMMIAILMELKKELNKTDNDYVLGKYDGIVHVLEEMGYDPQEVHEVVVDNIENEKVDPQLVDKLRCMNKEEYREKYLSKRER